MAVPRSVAPLDPQRFAPCAEQPVRGKSRRLVADTHVDPHSHPWAQVAFSATGVTRVTAGHSTYLVPPSRAVWIPPQVEHTVSVVEDADMRTLYVYQAPGRCGPDVTQTQEPLWQHCRVIEVSRLLRELVHEVTTIDPFDTADQAEKAQDPLRQRCIATLILDELRRAQPLPLGVPLPHDKRLRRLCEAVLDDPARHSSFDNWAAATGAGASVRTLTRLFREELGTSFVQWRHQVLLARALTLAARRLPMSHIAAELGYASPSAFSAMVTRTVGMAPSRFFGTDQQLTAE